MEQLYVGHGHVAAERYLGVHGAPIARSDISACFSNGRNR